jgi:hypothetical protein
MICNYKVKKYGGNILMQVANMKDVIAEDASNAAIFTGGKQLS